MANILCSPSKYVHGAGEMKKLGEYAQKYGKKALVLLTAVCIKQPFYSSQRANTPAKNPLFFTC